MGNLIKDITVTGSATTTLTLDTLTMTKGELYKLVFTVVNGTASNNDIRIDFNNNGTVTNYYEQQLKASSTTTSGARSNDNQLAEVLASNRTYIEAWLKVTNSGEIVWLSTSTKNYGGSSIELHNFFGTSTFTTTTVTEIDLTSTVANGIGINSRAQLYKVAEKVQDIEITTAKTQQDLTVDIQKGNEYLLVSDIVNATASPVTYYLGINDDTTTTNYYRQYLVANNTSVVGGRVNDNAINDTFQTIGSSSLSLTKIKLPNSGVFNYQSDIALRYGTANLQLYKFYGSKTSIVASVTKLNIVASVTSAIGIGSRFELYKLI